MLSEHDIILLKERGITKESVSTQISRFKTSFEQLDVLRAATPNDGIKILTPDEMTSYPAIYRNRILNNISVKKFVPASGAATRMFKDLYQYLDNSVPIAELSDKHPVRMFIELLPKFAFFQILQKAMNNHNISNKEVRMSMAADIIGMVLSDASLNYGKQPKGLVHFHAYPDNTIRTAMEEHLVEGCSYATDNGGKAQIHFTVSSEHEELFKKNLHEKGAQIEDKYKASLDVSFSFQKPHTDTLAVTPDNQPFRDKDGKLVFRPGGHGALIENLNELDADIIFIKNIDNVVHEHSDGNAVAYKMALGGQLLLLQNHIFDLLKKLDEGYNKVLDEIEKFIKDQLFASLPESLSKLSSQQKADYLRKYLNRPMRVCGMVRNEGEPGGGPFWVREKSGQETLQILESSQLDINNPHQAAQLKQATHFNPVDLVCAVKDYQGKKFDLTAFSDPETGFISEKSINGQPIKALELPGLWNGAMANWITLFVEVPVSTFNPVKTVNDLLRKQHQPN